MASFLGRHGEEKGVLPAFVLIESARAEKLAVDARRPIIGLSFQRHAATVATNVGRRKRALFSDEAVLATLPEPAHDSGMKETKSKPSLAQ